MRRAILLGVMGLCGALVSLNCDAQDFSRGYVRRDGAYVQPHFKSQPDGRWNNNWSTSPNVNPYTGRQGSQSPTINDRSPSYNSRNYGDPLRAGGRRR